MIQKASALALLVILLAACNPTVTIAPPSEPIRIEINATIRIVVEKDVEEMLEEGDLF